MIGSRNQEVFEVHQLEKLKKLIPRKSAEVVRLELVYNPKYKHERRPSKRICETAFRC